MGLMDCIEAPPVTRWSKFDAFMWYAELWAVALARLALLAGVLWLVWHHG